MRTAVHIVLLSCVTLYALSAPVMWGVYYLEADAIAAAYCVNPDKPSCHGKCHMAKLTAKKSGRDEAPPLVERTIKKPLLFLTSVPAAPSPGERPVPSYGSFSSPSLRNGYPQSVYHPPA